MKRIRLTEPQLCRMVNESVRRVQNEETDDDYEKYSAAREKAYRHDPYGHRYRYDEETLAVEDAFIDLEYAIEEMVGTTVNHLMKNLMQ